MDKNFIKLITCTLSLQLIVSQVVCLSRVRSFTNAKRSKFEILDFVGLVGAHGRVAEWHNVTTEDGYLLALFRIPPNSLLHNNSHSGSPVYMQHAFGTTAEIFISFGPESSLAYILSDAGYDVWLGNVRGTVYSSKHEILSPGQPQFWDFSLDEPALIDVPAMVDYVLKTTGKSKLSYIGYSMGTTLSAILLSNRPEYNDKMNLVVHFSHSTMWQYRSVVATSVALFEGLLRSAVRDGTFSILRNTELIYTLTKYLCRHNIFIRTICVFSYNFIFGPSYQEINPNNEDMLLSLLRFLSTISVKLGLHYLQHIKTGEFRFYDHGDSETNLLYYGQIQPPYYNISNIVAPLLIFQGTADLLTPLKNIPVFISKLPSSTTVILEAVKNFNHNDFLIVKDVKRLVHDKLLLIMSQYSKSN